MQHTIDKDQPTTVKITAADDTWDILKDVSVTTQNDYGVLIASTATNTQLIVNGTVAVATHDEAAINSTADGVNVTVGDAGLLSGEKGLNFFGEDSILSNHGTIRGAEFGVFSQGFNNQLSNWGAILSDTGSAVEFENHLGTLKNYGVVSGNVGVDVKTTVTDQKTTIENFGLITGKEGAIVAADDGTGHEKIVNTGVIKGDVSLGAADDDFTNTGGLLNGNLEGGSGQDSLMLVAGKVTGDVHGGDDTDVLYLGHGSVKGVASGDGGDDVYYVDHADAHIVEAAGQGQDMLFAISDYTLGKNVHIERLLTGAVGISLTGNNLANTLTGDYGNEHLSGGGGKDFIEGYAGADILTGGAGSDSFLFEPATGTDHITDFKAQGGDHDHILLSDDFDLDSFKDMKTHMSQHGDDVVINFGHGDKVVLDDVHLSDLKAEDFTFNFI